MVVYTRLSSQDRESIHKELAQGKGCNEIAKLLRRHPSTISREIRRCGVQGYSPGLAQSDSDNKQKARRKGKRKISGSLVAIVEKYLLEERFSPEQTSASLHKAYPSDPSMHVSHETIYQYIYHHKDPYQKRLLVQCLRKRKKQRRRRKTTQEKRGIIPNMISIHERPEAANQRQEAGHWEGDLVVGKDHKSAILTLVERVSRFTIIETLDGDLSSKATVQACEKRLSQFPPELRKSLTYDRGREMFFHEQLTASIGIKVFFADPHAPWQRGSNENTNGLIREFFPKGTDFSLHSREEIKEVERLLNIRPRKILQFHTPQELMGRYLECCV